MKEFSDDNFKKLDKMVELPYEKGSKFVRAIEDSSVLPKEGYLKKEDNYSIELEKLQIDLSKVYEKFKILTFYSLESLNETQKIELKKLEDEIQELEGKILKITIDYGSSIDKMKSDN